jgi:hypothetical protein
MFMLIRFLFVSALIAIATGMTIGKGARWN